MKIHKTGSLMCEPILARPIDRRSLLRRSAVTVGGKLIGPPLLWSGGQRAQARVRVVQLDRVVDVDALAADVAHIQHGASG